MTTLTESLGMFIVMVSPGFADEGLNVILFRDDSAFKPNGSLDTRLGLIISDIACDILKEERLFLNE